jgi:hypothetical protein
VRTLESDMKMGSFTPDLLPAVSVYVIGRANGALQSRAKQGSLKTPFSAQHLLQCPAYAKWNQKLRWFQFASDLYRPNDHRLSPKLVPTFAVRGTLRDQRILTAVKLDFLDCSRYCYFKVAPHLNSRDSGIRSRPTTTQNIWWCRESNSGPQDL